MNGGGDKESEGVRPGEGLVLVPPTLDDDTDIEPQDEGHWDEVAEVVAVE